MKLALIIVAIIILLAAAGGYLYWASQHKVLRPKWQQLPDTHLFYGTASLSADRGDVKFLGVFDNEADCRTAAAAAGMIGYTWHQVYNGDWSGQCHGTANPAAMKIRPGENGRHSGVLV